MSGCDCVAGKGKCRDFIKLTCDTVTAGVLFSGGRDTLYVVAPRNIAGCDMSVMGILPVCKSGYIDAPKVCISKSKVKDN